MIEHDYGLEAILNGSVYMISYLTEHGVDWRAAVGSYAPVVTTNACAQRALTRAVVKHILYGDAMHGCEYDGDSTHVSHYGCRLDTSVRRAAPQHAAAGRSSCHLEEAEA